MKDNNTIQNSVSQTNNYIINNTYIETPKTKENNMDKNNNKEQNFFILNKENQNYCLHHSLNLHLLQIFHDFSIHY